MLIDVRSPDQYQAAHIKNAVNFPCNRVSPPTNEDIMNDNTLQESLVLALLIQPLNSCVSCISLYEHSEK